MAIWAVNRTHVVLRLDASKLAAMPAFRQRYGHLMQTNYDGEVFAFRTDPISYPALADFLTSLGLEGPDAREKADFTLLAGREVLTKCDPEWLRIVSVTFLRARHPSGYAWTIRNSKEAELRYHPDCLSFINGKHCHW